MNYTYCTLIVSAANKQAAQELLGDSYFTNALSSDGTAPATHYISSGPFDNNALNTALNQTDVNFFVSFGMQPDFNDLKPLVEILE